ncbi:iron-containing alcohol dehydrogenase [Nocardioides currus]|uniref:iron-containing alcohol dehydrogenase n=1 Tax=Nocardioides currus TaxID=2133958 RepID=UPI001402CC29|nr:iron-containing alcohol dehydrogenase [Nocardioides currus]
MRAGVATAGARRGPRVVVGPGALGRLGDELERVGTHRPLVVCGRSTARDTALMDALGAALRGRAVELVDHVRPDVPLESVERVADAVVSSGADALVAVGGGGAITTARAANIVAHERSGLLDLSTHIDDEGRVTSPRLTGRRLPQVVVATTPTTAAPKAGAAVTVDGRRHALYDPRTRAASVVVDSTVTTGVPRDTRTAAVLNAYVMAVEGWMSPLHHPLVDVTLRGAVAELAEALAAALRGEPGTDDRPVIAAVAVGEATDVTGGGMTAALSHTIGPLVDVPNGILDALLLPHVVAASGPAQRDRLDDLSSTLGADVLDVVRHALTTGSRSTRLRDVGLPADSVAEVARRALDDVSAWTDRHPDPGAHAHRILAAAW